MGFLGLAIMGAPMAASLRRAGHELPVSNRTRQRAEAWAAEHGGTVAAHRFGWTDVEIEKRLRMTLADRDVFPTCAQGNARLPSDDNREIRYARQRAMDAQRAFHALAATVVGPQTTHIDAPLIVDRDAPALPEDSG